MNKSKCFLQGHGECRGKISREHYLSESILQQLSSGSTVTIGGLPWQPIATLQNIGLGALQAKILCEGHNNGLSGLDSVAGDLFRILDAIDKRPETVAPHVQINGSHIERWFLKVICGLVAGQRSESEIVPEEWKRILVGNAWPEGWGMYCFSPAITQIFAKDVHIATHVHPETKRILATQFFFCGACFFLLLGRPDQPGAFGMHRPRGLVFEIPIGARRVEFLWPFPTNEAMIYKKLGTTIELPSYRAYWQR